MRAGLEFLLGLLDADEQAAIAREDVDGVHGPAVRLWQRLGFVAPSPDRNPVPTCPHCGEGAPYLFQEQQVCHRCRSRIDPSDLLLWRLDREALLRWLAGQLDLRGGVQRIDGRLWQLGTWQTPDAIHECFYRRPGPLSDAGRERLLLYRNVLLLYGASLPTEREPGALTVSLLELLRPGDSLTVSPLSDMWRTRGNVRFDHESGALWAGETWLGEVPLGSKEFFFLDCLARHLDRFVPYSDLKRHVMRSAGSRDTTEEATFCQGLKSRIKKKWVPSIDRLITTTNKGDGYRLRGYVEV